VTGQMLKAPRNIKCLKFRFKSFRHNLIPGGRLFHTTGAHTLKERLAHTVLVLGNAIRERVDDLSDILDVVKFHSFFQVSDLCAFPEPASRVKLSAESSSCDEQPHISFKVFTEFTRRCLKHPFHSYKKLFSVVSCHVEPTHERYA